MKGKLHSYRLVWCHYLYCRLSIMRSIHAFKIFFTLIQIKIMDDKLCLGLNIVFAGKVLPHTSSNHKKAPIYLFFTQERANY